MKNFTLTGNFRKITDVWEFSQEANPNIKKAPHAGQDFHVHEIHGEQKLYQIPC